MHIAVRQAAVPDQGRGAGRSRRATSAKIQRARAPRNPASRAEIAAKMVEGAVNKFLGEMTLLGQPFVKRRQADGREDARSEESEGQRLRASSSSARASRRKQTISPPKSRDGKPERAKRQLTMPGAEIQAHPAQALGRSPDGRGSLRHQPADHRADRRRDRARSSRMGVRDRRGDRRRQHLPRRRARAPRAWTAPPPTTWACWPR